MEEGEIAPGRVVAEIARGLARERSASCLHELARQVGDFLVGRIVLDTEIQGQHRRELAGGRVLLQRYREGLVCETATDAHGGCSSGLSAIYRGLSEGSVRHANTRDHRKDELPASLSCFGSRVHATTPRHLASRLHVALLARASSAPSNAEAPSSAALARNVVRYPAASDRNPPPAAPSVIAS